MTLTELQELKDKVSEAQRELLQGYYNRIHFQKPSLDEIMGWLESDMLHVTMEEVFNDAEKILNPVTPLKEKFPLAFDTIKLPVSYRTEKAMDEAGTPLDWITDSKGMVVAQIELPIQGMHLRKSIETQDQIGLLICELLNGLQNGKE